MTPMRKRIQFGVFAVFLFVGLGGVTACETRSETGPEVEAVSAKGAELAPRGVVQRAELREDDGIVDGDTLRAVGFGQSIRLLCIDTEETLEGEDLEAATRDWVAYQEEKSAESEGPANYGTFLGNEATEFAREFFEEYDEIFVEYQSPKNTRGFYGRHLGYVWVQDGEDGPWKNYSVEAVRAGMSPYFTSFGWCDKYHDEFEAAQNEAREAQRGIWAPDAKGYDDYEERLQRWNRRARQVGLFRTHFADKPNTVELGTDTAMSSLRLKVGERVIVFGALDRHAPRARPPKLHLYHRHRDDFVVVVDEGLSFDQFGVDFVPNQFLYVEGQVEMYRGNPQLRVDMRSFIRDGDSPPPMRNR